MINNLDIAYAAGLLDGEGSLRIAKTGRKGEPNRFRYWPIVSVSNTHKPVLDWLHVKFGGGLCLCSNCFYKTNPNHHLAGEWRIQGGKAAPAFLQLVLPMLQIKRKQAELIIEFCRTSRGGRFTDVRGDEERAAYYQNRDSFREKLHVLNSGEYFDWGEMFKKRFGDFPQRGIIL